MLEKFHFPLAVFSNAICGESSVMSVTLIFLEKINGISSTPTFSDFAVTNGDFPNAGSSAMAILSAPTLPERIDKLRSPTVTCLPKAALASDCTVGRNQALPRSEEHTSELQSHHDLVCRLLLEKKKKKQNKTQQT